RLVGKLDAAIGYELESTCRREEYSGPRKLDHQLSYSGGPGKGRASESGTRPRSRPLVEPDHPQLSVGAAMPTAGALPLQPLLLRAGSRVGGELAADAAKLLLFLLSSLDVGSDVLDED